MVSHGIFRSNSPMKLVVLGALVIENGGNIACDEWYVLDLIVSSNDGHKRELYVFLIQCWIFLTFNQIFDQWEGHIS